MTRIEQPSPLSRAMFEAGWSNRRLARRLGVHESQVSRWRHGMHLPEIATRHDIAEALGHSAEELWPEDRVAA